MFNNADELGDFKLFFSFDHAAGGLNGDPNQYADYFLKYSIRPSYFNTKDPKSGEDKPLVSTFGAEAVPNSQWVQFKQKVGDVLVVPGFYQATPSSSFFTGRNNIDGVFNWNSWQPTSAGKIPVSIINDKTLQTAAHTTQRLFMIGISPIQFKALDSNNNWYRRGEDNLEYRLGQALDLQPDIIQLQSWNDAGEGHYMGNVWSEPLNQRTKDLTNEYDHKGYWQVLPAFIQAWKRGDTTTANMFPASGISVQGAFWHHTLTVDATCDADPVVKKSPDIVTAAEDTVSGIVLVALGTSNLVAVMNLNRKEIGRTKLVPGYNSFKFERLGPGKVQLDIWDEDRLITAAHGALEVQTMGPLCNWNFQVVGFSA
jgi:glucan endo-1,3-alpha-glucosidase